MSYYAAIDLGSTSFHLLVATLQNGQLVSEQKVSQKVRLAQGLCSENKLTKEAINKGLDALRLFSEVLKECSPDAVRVVATQALRQARNREVFIEKAEKILGYPVEVISGKEEANLIWQAIAIDCDRKKKQRLLTLDIGGGSTEIAVGRKKLKASCSMSLGCVTFTDQFFGNGKITKDAYQAAYEEALTVLEQCTEVSGQAWDVAYGSSGTIKAACAYTSTLYEGVYGRVANRDSLESLRKDLLLFDRLEDLFVPEVRPDRVPLLPAGLAILEAAFEVFSIDELKLSKSAMREGVIYSLANKESANINRVA